jgi:phosphatidate cytidylyltransferase
LFAIVLAVAAWLNLPLSGMLLTGIIIMAAALAGDLLGSSAKRRAGVKDYPPVMAVQGGLLDIMDSWIVAGAALALLAMLLNWAPGAPV